MSWKNLVSPLVLIIVGVSVTLMILTAPDARTDARNSRLDGGHSLGDTDHPDDIRSDGDHSNRAAAAAADRRSNRDDPDTDGRADPGE